MSSGNSRSFEDGFNFSDKRKKINDLDEDSLTQAYYENESLRMEVLFNFAEKKFPVKETFSQTPKLIALAEEEKSKFVQEIINISLLEDSNFRKNMEKIFSKGLK